MFISIKFAIFITTPVVAQLVEQLTVDQRVSGSNPLCGRLFSILYSTAVMANVYIPPEIQENVFSCLMHSSAKGLAFMWQIQESWFKVSFQRLQRALATNSRETYHRELVQLFQDIDQLPNLTDDKRIIFHKEMLVYILDIYLT